MLPAWVVALALLAARPTIGGEAENGNYIH